MKENFDWKNSRISLNKSHLNSEELDVFFDEMPKKFIEKNQEFLKESRFVIEKRGIFSQVDFEKQFTLNGSYKISDLAQLGETKAFFTQRDGRFSTKTSDSTTQYALRGPRYICALDPNLSVRQKLQILSEDAVDGINFLKNKNLPKEGQYNVIAPVLDYIKNTSVTVLNAYIHSEKNGFYNLDNASYQSEKKQLVDLVRRASFAYCLSLVDSLDQDNLNALLPDDTINIIENASKKIKKDFEKHEFPNDALARPEASHPLVMLGSVEMILSNYPQTETVVGIPAGSTEIACLIAETQKSLHNIPCDTILLPISNHSIKELQAKRTVRPESLSHLLDSEKDKLNGKNVIIVDDNASTGSTIQEARDSIIKTTNPKTIVSTVLEADIVRSKIDRHSTRRKNVAHPLLYDLSVSILPVSKNKWMKQDLKKIMETKQLIKFYKDKILEAKTPAEKIKYEVCIDDLENPTETMIEQTPPEKIIEKFQGTYLSNFYAAPVVRNGITYPSVEHAYQAAKFSSETFSSLNEEQKKALSEVLREKGYAEPIKDFGTIFTEPTIPSGITKTVANKLREWGFVRKDWDDTRIEIMINLLLQKYSIPELRDKLKDTKDLYLMEGNDWEDTLWGVCDGKGKNMLGRTIMNIREKIK